jgi:coenzyme PQQ biosynthesis protein C
MKDAAILSRMKSVELRRAWRQRIIDHDGGDGDAGGIARWIALTDGLGLERAYVESTVGLLPATRFAVDAYVHFVREKSLLEAVASSLTEMFSRKTISERLSSMLARYKFLDRELLAYFDRRLTQAPRDADFALGYVKREARGIDDQRAVIAALEFKCAVLWSQLDALYYAYVAPGLTPPGAFKPEG